MTTTHVTATTTVAPAAFVAALTDFSAHRGEVFGNSDASFYKVHELGPTWADVTEGSNVAGGTWQRLRYDWSTPNKVRLDVLDGNKFGKGGWWLYDVSPDGSGSRIDLTVHRAPLTFTARLLDWFLIGYGRVFHGRDLRRTLRKLEEASPPTAEPPASE